MVAICDELLIDQIYEAAVVPELWKVALDGIAEKVDAAGMGLFLVSGRTNGGGVWSDALHELCLGWIAGGWQERTQRTTRMMALDHAGFVADCDVFEGDEAERDDAIVNYLRPAGFGHGLGTGIVMPTGEMALYSAERRFQTGPFTRGDCLKLDPLRPHLARAALLSIRAGLERARGIAATLEALGIPGAVVRDTGRVLAANRLFEDLIPAVVQDRRDRLHLLDERADRLFAAALSRIAAGSLQPDIGSIPMPVADDDRLPMIVHLLPVRGIAHDFYLHAASILIVTPIDRSTVPAADVLQGLFDLTPAEARVAREIGRAVSVDNLAGSLGVAPETIRKQLKAVLAKTGARRQSELVSLLAGKSYPQSKP